MRKAEDKKRAEEQKEVPEVQAGLGITKSKGLLSIHPHPLPTGRTCHTKLMMGPQLEGSGPQDAQTAEVERAITCRPMGMGHSSGCRHSQAGTGLVGARTILCHVLVDGLVLCGYPHQGKANTANGAPSLRVPCPGGVARPMAQRRSRRTHRLCAGVAGVEQAGQSLLWVELAARIVDSRCRKRGSSEVHSQLR